MRKLLSALIAIFILSAGNANAAVITYVADLTGGQEVPAVVTTGSGTAVVKYDTVAHTLLVSVNFSNLIGNTTDSHIHCCVLPGVNAGVAVGFTPSGFPLGVSSGSFLATLDLTAPVYTAAFLAASGGTLALAEANLVNGLNTGLVYVNVHTNFRPGGEIRGQLQVPEPAMLVLLGLGAAGMIRRRRQHAR